MVMTGGWFMALLKNTHIRNLEMLKCKLLGLNMDLKWYGKNVGDHLENAWDHHFENVPGFSTYRLTLDPL